MKTRGFFTIATGDEKYYRFANHLLKSYRLHNTKYPFAILCDRENEYTKDFDQVVILDNVKCNYEDKFRLVSDSPYYEGIFLEPDCLIYRDISCFFDLLAKESDLTSFGWNDSELSAFFDSTEKVLQTYGKKIETVPIFCPGYMFVRKTEKSQKIYRDLTEIAAWLLENCSDQPVLMAGKQLRDDPVFFIAMKLNDCVCPVKPSVGKCIYLPRVKKIKKISLKDGRLDVIQEKEYNDSFLMHFTTRRCVEEGLYWHQTICLKMCDSHYPSFLISVFEKMFFYYILHFLKKGKYYLKSKLKK